MHFHIVRQSYNGRTGVPLEPVEIGIALDYVQARAAKWQDQKQFRTPDADKSLLHYWEKTRCDDGSHIPGPAQKGHGVR